CDGDVEGLPERTLVPGRGRRRPARGGVGARLGRPRHRDPRRGAAPATSRGGCRSHLAGPHSSSSARRTTLLSMSIPQAAERTRKPLGGKRIVGYVISLVIVVA